MIGCGKIGSELADQSHLETIITHAGAYRACPDVELRAVCDIEPAKLERCGERWEVAARYGDPARLFVEERPEIVSICTPDDTHYELIRQAILSPGMRAVLAEKPLALKMSHAEELVRLAHERGVLLAVNYLRRYSEGHVHLREYIQSGKIGAIQTVGGFYNKGTIHNGTHWFDLARFLVGEVFQVWGVDVQNEGGGDPTLDAFLKFECGAGGHLQGCDARYFALFEMDLVGTKGRARVTDLGYRFETYRVTDCPYFEGYQSLVKDDGIKGGFRDEVLHAIEDLVYCLNNGGEPRCTGEDGLTALEVALAVIESARSGRLITLRDN